MGATAKEGCYFRGLTNTIHLFCPNLGIGETFPIVAVLHNLGICEKRKLWKFSTISDKLCPKRRCVDTLMRAQMHLVSLNTQNTNPNAFGGAKYPNESPNAFGDENFQIPNAFPNLYLVSTSSYSSSYSFHSSSTVVSSLLVRKGQSCRNFHI